MKVCKRNNRVWALLVLLIIGITLHKTTRVFAYDEKEHAIILEKVLLGDGNKLQNYRPATQNAVVALEEASSLFLDQFNHSKANELESLRSKVKKLPSTIDEFDFSSTSLEHRKDTHRGWSSNAYKKEEKKKSHWSVRKDLLLKTVSQLWTKDSQKAEAFAKLIYYVHILGDYQYDRKQALKKLGISERADVSEIEGIDTITVPLEAKSVADYIARYQRLPDYYVTKEEAKEILMGRSGASLQEALGGLLVGGDSFANHEGHLPELKTDGKYFECDIGFNINGSRNGERLVYSNNGVVYYTNDHYSSFCLLRPELFKTQYPMISLGGAKDKNDIIDELLGIFEILFEDQTGSNEYMSLTRGMKAYNKEIAGIMGSGTTIDTNGKYLRCYRYASDLLLLLERYLPELLKEVDFFAKVVC